MTKRDLLSLSIAPVILLVISINLLWLSSKVQQGAERRLGNYAVLQRITAPGQVNSASPASARSAETLSNLSVADGESDVATVNLSVSLATLLLCVALFQIIILARLLRKERLPAAPARIDTVATSAPEMKLGTHRTVRQPERVGGR
jgi:hypothetical protein